MVTGIELEQAAALITGALAPLGTQTLPVPDALGYTLDADVTAPLDQPPFDRSPLDGYALRAADIASASRERPVRLHVVETVYAGGVPLLPLTAGAAARIMTGAMLPAGCDCVLRQEDTDQGDPVVSIYKPLRPCENYVNRGPWAFSPARACARCPSGAGPGYSCSPPETRWSTPTCTLSPPERSTGPI